jgi:antitoxin component YwqK of YwqJK toxin-antitoxin module
MFFLKLIIKEKSMKKKFFIASFALGLLLFVLFFYFYHIKKSQDATFIFDEYYTNENKKVTLSEFFTTCGGNGKKLSYGNKTLIQSEIFKNGARVKSIFYDLSGKTSVIYEYFGSFSNRIVYHFYKNGKMKAFVSFENNLLDGKMVDWDFDGNIIQERIYIHNKLISKTKWDSKKNTSSTDGLNSTAL